MKDNTINLIAHIFDNSLRVIVFCQSSSPSIGVR
jgi:hypothetical protein